LQLSLSENLGIHWNSNSQSGSSFGSVRVHSLTLSYNPESMQRDSWASLLARNLASPCFGRKLKARVTTISTSFVTCELYHPWHVSLLVVSYGTIYIGMWSKVYLQFVCYICFLNYKLVMFQKNCCIVHRKICTCVVLWIL
jgi:hypothetical protein